MLAAARRAKELKGLDTDLAIATQVVDTTGSNANAFVVNLVQAGTGSWNRVGRKIYPQSLRLRGIASLLVDNSATTSSLFSNTLRMVVVWDKNPNSSSSIPVFSTIFGRTEQDGTESTQVLDSLRFDNTDRFRVLKDCVMTAQPQADGSGAGGTINAIYYNVQFDEYIKIKNKETVYSGQSDPMTIADISSGAIYVYFRAALDDASTNGWLILPESYARLRYYD